MARSLKAVTGDPKRIEDVLKRVTGLVGPIEAMKNDPFDLKVAPTWKSVMSWFEQEVVPSKVHVTKYVTPLRV